MSIGEIKKLPIYTLWELHKNIEPIAAEESLRMIRCLSTVMNPKADKLIDKLTDKAKGLIEIEHDNGFDREGVATLRRKMGFR